MNLNLEGATLTCDPRCPETTRLALRDGVVVKALGGPYCTVRLPDGAVAVPGFVDPHLHLLACAAARLSVDLSPERSVSGICRRIAEAVRSTEGSGWVRARGYETWRLSGARSPDRHDLDQVSPHRPVIIHDGTGHEAVCNTPALEALGLFDQRAGGLEVERGQPTGRIHHGERLLARVPALDPRLLRKAMHGVSTELSREGITAVTDATSTNGLSELSLLSRWHADGTIAQRVEAMVSVHHVDAVAASTLSPGASVDGVVVGHAKIIVEEVAGELAEHVAAARLHGFPLAMHTLDVETLAMALGAVADGVPHASVPDRLEHVALSLPEQVLQIAATGLSVVTQPSFLTHRGDRYASELSPTEQAWLYRVGSLRKAGVRVAASSDAPVAPARPLEIPADAVDRAHHKLHDDPGERVDWGVALDLITRSAGSVGTVRRGVLEIGAPGDVAVLSGRPGGEPGGDGEYPVRVLATLIGGEPTFDPGGLFAAVG